MKTVKFPMAIDFLLYAILLCGQAAMASVVRKFERTPYF